MNWEKLQNNSRYKGITIKPHFIVISASAFKELGEPKQVSIEFDREERAVRFIKDGDFKVHSRKGIRINCSLGMNFPCGKYLLENDTFKQKLNNP